MASNWLWFIHPAMDINTNRNGSGALGISLIHYHRCQTWRRATHADLSRSSFRTIRDSMILPHQFEHRFLITPLSLLAAGLLPRDQIIYVNGLFGVITVEP